MTRSVPESCTPIALLRTRRGGGIRRRRAKKPGRPDTPAPSSGRGFRGPDCAAREWFRQFSLLAMLIGVSFSARASGGDAGSRHGCFWALDSTADGHENRYFRNCESGESTSVGVAAASDCRYICRARYNP